MKKTVLMILSIVLSAMCLSACSGDKQTSTAPTSSPTPTAMTMPSPKPTPKQETENVQTHIPATDFEIMAGSTNVDIISSKNYNVTCPYCGYVGRAMGTSDIYMTLNKHYAGETYTYTQGFMCASAYQGGCRQNSTYSITVKYK